jgi:hypothetical protein
MFDEKIHLCRYRGSNSHFGQKRAKTVRSPGFRRSSEFREDRLKAELRTAA